MKSAIGFIFFMLFLAGVAFVNLRGMQGDAGPSVSGPDRLIDAGWRPTHLGEMTLADETEMFLQFDAGGEFAGHGGCNRLFGSYGFDEGTIAIGPVGATRMACGSAIDALEITYLEALENTSRVLRVDNRLALRDANDVTLLRFIAVPRQPGDD